MSISKSFSAAALAVALVSSVPVAEVAFAQASPGAAAQQPAQSGEPNRPHRARASHIEGRLAFLKTELKISDAQNGQWNAFADVLRQQDKARRERFEQMRANRDQNRDQQLSAVEHLERREKASEAQAQDAKQFLTAFRPLYQSLSDEQKKTADDLFGRPHGHHHGMRWR